MGGAGQVRINGGALRGRVLSFTEKEIRPTKATVRKTLFNWLRPIIAGRSCMDCFSGSGVLAFEAVSEGAEYVLCLDRSSGALKAIKANAERLGVSEKIEPRRANYPDALRVVRQFDLVFMDPPFSDIDVNESLLWLVRQSCMRRGCLVYVECLKGSELMPVDGMVVLKRARSADVDFYLLLYQGEEK